jgi:hypothetical protein
MEHGSFGRPRAQPMLARVIADLAGFPTLADEEEFEVDEAEARRVRRRRLHEQEMPPKW